MCTTLDLESKGGSGTLKPIREERVAEWDTTVQPVNLQPLTHKHACAILALPKDHPGPIERPTVADEINDEISGARLPEKGGVNEILEIASLLKADGVPCCVVGSAALIYFGTTRMRDDWALCVPTEHLEEAASALRGTANWEESSCSFINVVGNSDHLFPRFKLTSVALFIILVSSQYCHLPCDFDCLEYGQTGLPFPKLNIYVQSLLETHNLVDLEDLVDGMNLTEEWGDQNLDLSGTTDAEWAIWINRRVPNGSECAFCHLKREDPVNLRGTWLKVISRDRKARGQGWKYKDNWETRFWKRGQKDPRLRTSGY